MCLSLNKPTFCLLWLSLESFPAWSQGPSLGSLSKGLTQDLGRDPPFGPHFSCNSFTQWFFCFCFCFNTEGRMYPGVSQWLLGPSSSGRGGAEDASRETTSWASVLNRWVCWSRAKIFMQIIKRYEMLIIYKPPNESFKEALQHIGKKKWLKWQPRLNKLNKFSPSQSTRRRKMHLLW